MEEVRRVFRFSRRMSEHALYDTLKSVADETLSSWRIGFEKIVNYSPAESRPPYSFENEIAGTIEKGNMRLKITASVAESEERSVENYFSGIELIEPYGWNGGTVTPEDREGLGKYADEVIKALARTEIGEPEGRGEEKAKPARRE